MTATTDDSPSKARQAQLTAAAQALRTWVNEQRQAWPDRPVVAVSRPQIEAPRPAANPEPLTRKEKRKAKRDEQRREKEAAAAVPEPPEIVPIAVPPVREVTLAPVADGRVYVDDQDDEEGRGWLARAGIAVAAVVILGAMGFVGWNARDKLLSARDSTPKMGTAVLESVPPGSDVFIDGTPAGKAPVTKELEAGKHMVEFRRRSSSRKLQVEVVAGRTTLERLDWTAKRKGSLEVLTEPDGASVSIDGTPRGVTPLTIDDLTVGTHTVLLESSNGSLTRTVTISADTVSQITEAIYSGWLHVSSPIELQLSEGARVLQLDERNQLLLPPGNHDLLFENRALGFKERRRVEIKPGRIAAVTIAPAPSMLNVTASLPAEVIVDGVRVGEAPLANHPIDIGTRSVVVRSITGAERRYTVTAAGKPTTLDVDFSKP